MINGRLKSDEEDERFPPGVPDDVFAETAPFLETNGACVITWALFCVEKALAGTDLEPGDT